MRLFLLAALLSCAGVARAAAPSWRVDDMFLTGAGRYSADDFSAGVLWPSGRWDLSTRVKSFQFLDSAAGNEVEYSARLARNLPHVGVAGRLGTAPPNSQRLSYRLASGEAVVTLYGTTVGPPDAAYAATVAEDTATAAAQASLDRTWITRARVVYANTDFHHGPVTPTGHDFIVVQNSWQFSISETWRERTTFAFDAGGNKYNETLHPSDPSFRHWNVDYEGAPLALGGYPNDQIGAEASQKLGDWTARAAFTRINMLFGGIHLMTGGVVSWRPRGGPFEARAGWFHHRVFGASTRESWTFGGAYRW